MTSDVDEYIKTINQCKGVDKIFVIQGDGFPVRMSTNEDVALYTYTYWHLAKKAQQLIKSIDITDKCNLVRYRSKKNETLLAIDNGYVMIIVQNPKVE